MRSTVFIFLQFWFLAALTLSYFPTPFTVFTTSFIKLDAAPSFIWGF